jgi:hypothetical protein
MSSSTKTVGYFNPNRWPVIVNISAANVNITVPPKGYVTDRDTGKKVNDPLLEKFVGADMLARETSKTEVPCVLFFRPPTPVNDAHHRVFGSSTSVVKDSRGIVKDQSFDGAIALNTGHPDTTTPTHSVKTYTAEQAVKNGIFRPVIIPDDSKAPQETAGQPSRGDNLPPLLHARDASPGEARRLAEKGIVRVEVPVEVAQKSAPDKPAGEEEEHDSSIPGADDGGNLDLAEHLNKLKAQMEAPVAPATTEPTTPPVPTAAPIPPKPIAPFKPAAPMAPVVKPDPYVCAADGKSFKRKGYLLNYVKKNFSDREKELMAPYAEAPDDPAT